MNILQFLQSKTVCLNSKGRVRQHHLVLQSYANHKDILTKARSLVHIPELLRKLLSSSSKLLL